MKCPRCSSTVPANPDPSGFLVCPGCGARLRTRATTPAGPAGGPGPGPNTTLPPGTAMPTVPRPAAMAPQAPRATAAPPSRPQAPAAPPSAPAVARLEVTLEAVMQELRVVRRLQEETLALVRGGGSPSDLDAQFVPELPSMDPDSDPIERPTPRAAPIAPRSRRRKTVLLIDDDPETCQAAVAALTQGEVPVRVAREGREALGAIAEDKPDVIAMELDIGGAMAGKDVINMIKATMEWVDIPIVLYTRLPIESQKEARTIHGADEFVIKGPQGAESLVSRVIAVFRRG